MHEKTFRIVTLGCKVNQYESAYIGDALCNAGWIPARDTEKADAIIVNTCIVTHKASRQSRQAIRKAIRENQGGCIAAIGCYAQVFPDELADIEGISLVAGNSVKGDIPALVEDVVLSGTKKIVLRKFDRKCPFDFMPIKGLPGRSRAFLKIQDGCEAFCSYCIVPFARGPYRSLMPRDVLFMLHSLADQGFREVVLTGIHIGKYGVDLQPPVSLTDLLKIIAKEDLPLRVRISSIEPNEIDPDLIDMMASERWLCRHFHIPLQSGDDRILRKMRRRYTVREFANVVASVYTKIPLAAIGVDVISGFPGETDGAHMNTLSCLQDLPVSYCHIFPFSPRSGTAAFNLNGRVGPETIKQRTAQLRSLAGEKKHRFYTRCLNMKFSTVVEGWHCREKGLMKGITDNYIPVIFSSGNKRPGSVLDVLLKHVKQDAAFGEIVP